MFQLISCIKSIAITIYINLKSCSWQFYDFVIYLNLQFDCVEPKCTIFCSVVLTINCCSCFVMELSQLINLHVILVFYFLFSKSKISLITGYRSKREEAKITAWENLQKAKAEAAIRKLEVHNILSRLYL